MILDSIRLENFGAYGGINEAELTPTDQKPVVLFGGMNGGGKTTFLDALLLVLYGPKAKVSNRTSRMAYDAYLSECIHRCDKANLNASITLRFRRVMDGRTHYFELVRKWSKDSIRIKETVQVTRNGVTDPILTEHWDEVVESYLPVAISNLFFFDGEQIKELAQGGKTAQILGTAIHSLLGLDLVDRLEVDLKTFERRKKSEVIDEEAAKKLKHAEQEYKDLEIQLEEIILQRGNLVNEVGRLSKEAKEKEDRFKAEGGDLFTKRKNLERELQQLENDKTESELSLREIASGHLPFKLADDLLSKVETQVQKDFEVNQSRLILDVLLDRDEQIIFKLKSENVDAVTLDIVCQALIQDRNNRKQKADLGTVLDFDTRLSTHISNLRDNLLPTACLQVRDIIASIRNLEERIARIELDLGRVPEADAIAKYQDEMETAKREHLVKFAELEAIDIRVEAFKRQRDEAIRKIENLSDQNYTAQIAEDDRQRIIKHSNKVRATLGHFRTKVITRHIARMEALMLESFQKLLRKKELVYNLKIDPETFEVSLRDKRGEVLPFDRLSAGERQLLATAMLWGLARASGRPIPTVIDTPLGRLDSAHRSHLVELYFPQASHQVLLLSTDEEIVKNYHEKLKPTIAHHYLLDHDEKAGRTEIKTGYFKEL